jgi:hypothetical protein
MDVDSVEADGFGASDWLKSIGGVLFFVAGLLPWWSLGFAPGLSEEFNAFDYDATGLVPYVIFVGIAVLTIIIKTDSLRLPKVLVHPVLSLVAAVFGTVLVVYRFFVDGYDDDALEATDNTISRGIGMYLAVAAASIVLVGCVLASRGYRAQLAETAEAEASPDEHFAPRQRSQPPLP